MNKTIFTYIKFLFLIIFKKKNTIIIPIVSLIIIIAATIAISFTKDNSYLALGRYLVTFGLLLITMFFASLKALNIFKDLEKEGVELIIFSKPISRNQIILSKVITFLLLGLLWAILNTILLSIFFYYSITIEYYAALVGISFAVGFFTFVIFGSLTSLIAYKFNSKIALSIPLVIFTPLILGGLFISANSKPTNENAAFYLNKPYQYHRSNTEVDANEFYLNNNKDKFYLMPNGYGNSSFSNLQNNYLNEVMNLSNNSAKEWQIYSWAITPYQLLDIYNINNIDILNLFNNNKNPLSDYVYYSNLESPRYTYLLNKNSDILKLNTWNAQELKNEKKYIVPGALKDDTHIPDLINSSVIYARKNADNFNILFPEDNFSYAANEDLVGDLKWKYFSEILANDKFNFYANKLWKDIIKQFNDQLNDQQNDEAKIRKNKKLIFAAINKELNNQNSVFYNINDANVNILSPNAVKDKKLKSETERKLYIGVALLYNLYFNYNDSELLKTILINDNILRKYEPSQIVFNIDGNDYYVGGYEKYIAKQYVNYDKVVIRYELTKNDNYVFQKVSDVYAIQRNKTIVNKNYYILLWAVLSGILVMGNALLYRKRDYK